MKKHLVHSLALTGALACASVPAFAADVTWTGNAGGATDPNWSNGANWSTAAAPANGDNLIFSGFNQLANNNDLTGLLMGWLRFDQGGYVISGNALTLNSGITNASTPNVLATPLTLGASQLWHAVGGSFLALSNTLALGANQLSAYCDGDLTLAGVISGTGGSIIKYGPGTLTFAAANTHTGGLTADSGMVNANTPNGSTYGTVGNGNLVINAGATVTANADNAVFGQSGGLVGRRVTINAGGTLTTGDRSGHLVAVVLNGGILSGTTPRGDYGNWNIDYGVSTLTNGSVSSIEGGNVTLGQTGGTIFNIGAGDTVNVSSVIARTTYASDFGLIKAGAGVLNLLGANTYVSATTVSAGTLALRESGALINSSSITVASNAVFDVSNLWVPYSLSTNQTLSGQGSVIGSVGDDNAGAAIAPGGNGVAGILSIQSLTLNGNLALNFDLSNVAVPGAGTNDLLYVTNLTLSAFATNTVNLTFLKGSPLLNTPYTLIRYETTSAPDGNIATLAAAASRFVYVFNNNTTTKEITLTVTGNPANLVWKGDGTQNWWDITTTPNWLKNGTTPDVFYQSDNVTFNDVGSNTPPVNLTTVLQPGTVTINATKDYVLGGIGKLSGGAALVKNGAGAVALQTDNDFIGGASINAGTMVVGSGGTAGAIGNGAINNDASLIFNRSDSPTVNGPITGTGKVLKLGAGTVATMTSNTFSGSLVISNGGVQLGNVTAGEAGFRGSITNYGTLHVRGTNSVTLPGPIVGLGGIQCFGTNQVRFNNVNLGFQANLEVGNSASGTPTLLVGAGDSVTVGRMFFGQAANYAGNLNQSGGTITVTDISDTEGPMRVGHWPTETSTYNMTGGQLIITNGPNARIALGIDGTGVWNINGGTAIVNRIDVNGRSATGNGTLNLTNGTIMLGIGGLSSFAPYTLNLAGGMIGSLNNWTSALTNTLTGAFTLDSGPFAVTLSGPLTGPGSLTKQGGGVLNLNSATSSSLGPINVTAGTLQGSGTVPAPITVQSGATLSAGGTLGTGTLTTSNVTLNAGASLMVDLSSTAATSDLIAARGPLTLDAATPLYFNFLGGVPYTGGTYTIITNWSSRSGSLSYANPSRYSVNLDQSNPNRVQVTFTGTNANLVWKGNVNSLWDVNATANWVSGSTAEKFYQADAVIFDNSGLTTPNVNLVGDMLPTSVTVNSSGNYLLTGGGIAGMGTLSKSGSGTLTLANNNTFTGATTIGGGTLQLGNGGAAGNLAGNIVNHGTLVFNRADTATYAGIVSGTGSVTVNSPGKTILTGNNTYLGTTAISGGASAQVGGGLLPDAGQLGLGTVNNLGSLTFFRAGSPTIASPIIGNGALTFLGCGGVGQSSYSLSATNTFSGPVTLNLARVIAQNPFSLGSLSTYNILPGAQIYAPAAGAVFAPTLNLTGQGWAESAGFLGALRLGGGATWAGNLNYSGNTRITAYNDTGILTGTITGTGQLDLGLGTGTLTLAPSAPNTIGALRISGQTVVAGNANALPDNLPLTMSGGTLQLNGNNRTFTDFISLTGGSIQNGSTSTTATVTLNIKPTLPMLYSGTFADGSTKTLSVVKTGGGLLTLSGISTSLGGVTVNEGVLALNNGGGNGTVKGTLTANPGTTILSLNNDSLGYNAGNNQVTNLVLNGSSFIHVPNNNLTLWQNLVVNMTGAYFAATNTGGAARLDFGTGASLNTWPSAVSSVIHGVGVASATGSGTGIYLRQGNTVFTVADGAAADDLLISAPINQAGANSGITKNGPGRLKLTGPVAFSGSLLINGGSVVLGATSSLNSITNTVFVGSGCTLDVSATGAWTLNPGETLQGGGLVIGSVTDNVGTVLRPGASAGTLTINGDLNLSGYGTLDYELADVTTIGSGVNDLIQVNGNVSLNDFSPTVVSFTFLNGAPSTGTYTILKYTGSLTGTIPGAITNSAGYIATFSHNTGAKAIQVTFTSPAQNLVWEGDGGANTWDLTPYSTVWYNDTMNTNFYQGDTVRFDDTRTSFNTSVNINDSVKPKAITIDSANAYSFGGLGKISGITSLTKSGSGTATLGTANDFVGPINVNAGKLMLAAGAGVPTPLGAPGNTVTVANGATFDFGDNSMGNNNARGYNFVIAGAGSDGQGALQNSGATGIASYANVSNLTLTADSVVGGNSRWDIGNLPNTKLDGGGFALTKVGVGALDIRPVLLTNLTSITVSNGLLFYENYDQTNAWTANTTNYVRPGASIGNYGGRLINLPIELDSATILNQGGGTPLWFSPIKVVSASTFSSGGAQNFYGPITGAGSIGVGGGTGTLTFTNANSFNGGIVLSNALVSVNGNTAAGTAALVAGNASALGTGVVKIEGSAITANTITNTVRAIEFNVANGGIVPAGITLPTSLITNVSLHGRDATSVFTLAGKISGGHAGLTNWFDNAAGNVGATRLANSANDFVVGRLTLNRGVLAITSDGALGNSANVLFPVANSTLRFDATGINLAHPILAANNPVYLDMYGDTDGNGVVDTVNNVTVSSLISGAGTIFPRGTNGTMTLTANNTFSGGFELQQPLTLQVAASANLGTAYIAIKFGSTFRYTGTGTETMTRTLWMDNNGGGTIDVPSATASLIWNPGAGTLNQNLTKTGDGSLTLGRTIGGDAIIRVNGGTLVLTAANTYAGSTLVNNGTLIVNGSLGAGSPVTVAGGATLAGNGAVNGTISLQVGGTLQPGVAGIGRLAVNNALNLSGNTIMEISKAAGTNDSITGITSLSYGGSLIVNNLGGTLAAGDTYKLFTAWAYLGSFSAMTLPALPAGLAWDTTGLLVDGTIKVVNAAPPALSGASMLSDGNLRLTLTGTTGQGYRILVSPDVTAPVNTWTVLTSGTLPTATFYYDDLTATNSTTRFYIISTP